MTPGDERTAERWTIYVCPLCSCKWVDVMYPPPRCGCTANGAVCEPIEVTPVSQLPKLTGDEKECPVCGSYLRGCPDCGAETEEDGGCGSCIGLLPSAAERERR